MFSGKLIRNIYPGAALVIALTKGTGIAFLPIGPDGKTQVRAGQVSLVQKCILQVCLAQIAFRALFRSPKPVKVGLFVTEYSG